MITFQIQPFEATDVIDNCWIVTIFEACSIFGVSNLLSACSKPTDPSFPRLCRFTPWSKIERKENENIADVDCVEYSNRWNTHG